MQILSFTAVAARIAEAHGASRPLITGRIGYYRREGLIMERYRVQHATGAPVAAYGPVDMAVAAALRAVSSICYDWRNLNGEEPPFDYPIEQVLADIRKGRKRSLKLRFYQTPDGYSVQATLNGKFNERPQGWTGFTDIALDLTGALRGLL